MNIWKNKEIIMAFDQLLNLVEQSRNFCNRLFAAVLKASSTSPRFNRLCNLLDRALERLWRRERLAGLCPLSDAK
jgi:hypothetical protein